MYFKYGKKEIEYLKSQDEKLAAVIDQIGHIRREVNPDLFQSVAGSIIGQQISSAAQRTIWQRMCDAIGEITAETVLDAGADKIQSLGTSFRKAEYIMDFARKVESGEFPLESLPQMTDKEVIDELKQLKGIGVWTAEMLLLFCMQRSDILSYDDLAIRRGLRMVYHHRKIDRKLFEKYRRRYSPYGSTASLYLWAVAGGAIEGMRDYAPKKKA